MNKSVTRYWVALSLIVTLLPAAARPDPYEAALDFYAAEQFEAAVIELRNVLQESPGNVPEGIYVVHIHGSLFFGNAGQPNRSWVKFKTPTP